MEPITAPAKKKVPLLLVVLAILGFTPIVGPLFGLASIIISLTNFRRYLLIFIIGLAGILFWVIVISLTIGWGGV